MCPLAAMSCGACETSIEYSNRHGTAGCSENKSRLVWWLEHLSFKPPSRVRVPGAAMYLLFAVCAASPVYAACTRPGAGPGLPRSAAQPASGLGLGVYAAADGPVPPVTGQGQAGDTAGWPRPRACSMSPEFVGLQRHREQQTAWCSSSVAAEHLPYPPPGWSFACSGLAPPPPPAAVLERRRLVMKFVRRGRYFRSRIRYDSKTDSTYQCCRMILIQISDDIELNPGPETTTTAGSNNRRGQLVTQSSSLRILHQNSRSLRNKLGVLRAHAPELGLYDVIGISETWLSRDVSDEELRVGLSCHTWFRRDRPTHGGGGVACAVRSNLSPARRHDLEPADAELLIVELTTVPRLLVGVCYCPPADDGTLDRTMAALQAVVQRYPDRCVMLLGDFNIPDIRWRSSGLSWAVPTTSRLSRRATNFIDASCMPSS